MKKLPIVMLVMIGLMLAMMAWTLPARPASKNRPAPTTATASPEAIAKLEAVRAHYSPKLPMSMPVTVEQDFDVAGQVVKDTRPATMLIDSARRFRVESPGVLLVVGDGESVGLYSAQDNTFYRAPTLLAAAGVTSFAISGFIPFLSAEPITSILPLNSDTQLVEGQLRTAALDGTATYDIDASGQLNAIVLDQTKFLADAGARDVKRAAVTIKFGPVSAAPTTQPSTFVFTPPIGARDITGKPSSAGGEASAKEGEPAPDFKLKDAGDQEISLSSLKGSPVVLDFWATWCGPCRVGMKHLNEKWPEWEKAGLKLYAVNLEETPDDVKAFMEKNGLQLPVLFDTDAAVSKNYGVSGIPHTVVIDREGKITKVIVGLDEEGIDQAVEQAIKGK
jgi:peroxiredoxin/outer membrane lipoprotein-sorting protein